MKHFFTTILRFENLTWKHWTFLFAIFLIVHVPAILYDKGTDNLAVMQANALLNGRLDIDEYFWDASVYEGRYYVCFPPFPAVVALPFAAIQGHVVNSVLISILLTCLSMFLFYRILQRIMPQWEGRRWLFLGFFFGTGYWYVMLTSHHVNGFAHVVCTAMLMLLLYELTGKQRPILLGLFLGGAFLSRQMAVFYGIMVVYALFFQPENKWEGLKKVTLFGGAFALLASSYLLFNYLRFDNPLETGYQYIIFGGNWHDVFKTRIENHGLFDVKYFFYNLYYLLIKGHDITFMGDDRLNFADMDPFGTSLLVASPFIIASFKAKAEKGFLITSWVIIVLIAAGGLFYHNNGWQQINTQRFTVDFLPILMVLVAKGYGAMPYWLFRGLVFYAVILNVFSFFIHALESHYFEKIVSTLS